MKKVLILTASTGEGHNQAANSIAETLSFNNFKCIKYEFLRSRSNFLNKLIVKGYEILAFKFPKFYGFFYKFTDSSKTNLILKPIFKFTSLRVKKVIDGFDADIIIGTHPMTVNVITMLKKNGLKTPFISIVTDFKAHYTYINPLVDAYITGSNYTKNSLIDKGISPSKIYPIGIPVKSSFYLTDETIIYLKDNEYLSVLLMGGSMGLSDISFVLKKLLNNKNKLRITVVCGNNKKLEKTLTHNCSKTSFINKKIHILGYTNDIPQLMEYSDCLITKPGGLTISEAIVKNIPIIIPFAIPGQETENTDFLVKNNYAYYIKDLNDINKLIDEFVANKNILNTMKNNLSKLSSTYSPYKLLDIVNDLLNKNKDL